MPTRWATHVIIARGVKGKCGHRDANGEKKGSGKHREGLDVSAEPSEVAKDQASLAVHVAAALPYKPAQSPECSPEVGSTAIVTRAIADKATDIAQEVRCEHDCPGDDAVRLPRRAAVALVGKPDEGGRRDKEARKSHVISDHISVHYNELR
jgi:hypothetical protein